MDLQSFIQSGLLEAYVLGQCTPEERAQVERMASQHALVRAELASIEASLEGYAASHAVQPPSWMKASILQRIDQEATGQNAPNPASQVRVASKVGLRVAQTLAFLLAAATAFLFLKQKDLGGEKKQLEVQSDSLRKELAASNNQLLILGPLAELLCDPNTQRILVSNGKEINTIVYYNAHLNKMAYDPYALPAPKPGKYYQFWAIVDNKPVSLGMKADNMCQSLRPVQNPIAFAISEEDNPNGNPTPTTVLAIQTVG